VQSEERVELAAALAMNAAACVLGAFPPTTGRAHVGLTFLDEK